jgi:hypothetical protein
MGREYPVKKGISLSYDRITDVLKQYCQILESKDNDFVCNFPGMKKMIVRSSGKRLFVETETDIQYKNPQETIRIFNDIIEKLTGYSAKERKKLVSKE